MFKNYKLPPMVPQSLPLTNNEKEQIIDAYTIIPEKNMHRYMKILFPKKKNQAKQFVSIIKDVDNSIADVMPVTTQANLLIALEEKSFGISTTLLTYTRDKAIAYGDGTGSCTWIKFKGYFNNGKGGKL